MSKGSFIFARYQSSKLGTVHPVRIQPETLTLVIAGLSNPQPAAVNSRLEFKAGRGRGKLGLYTRMVYFRFLPGQAPPGYSPETTHELPWLSSTNSFRRLLRRSTGTYLGQGIIFAGTLEEIVS